MCACVCMWTGGSLGTSGGNEKSVGKGGGEEMVVRDRIR